MAAHVRSLGRAVTPVAVPGDPVKGEAISQQRQVRWLPLRGDPDLASITSRRAAALYGNLSWIGADVPPDFVLLHAVTACAARWSGLASTKRFVLRADSR